MEGITELENQHFTTLMQQYIQRTVINGFLSERLTGCFTMEASDCYHVGGQNNAVSPKMSIS